MNPFSDHPSNELYQNFWDNMNIGYYQLNEAIIPDTLLFDLQLFNNQNFVFPVPSSNKVISRFGKRGSRFHSGTDVKLYKGDTIVAAFDGKVRLSRSYHGYGLLVAIRHHNGLETLYGHLSKIMVKENEWVTAGTPIGLGGRTGRATTEHLHFEVRILGIPINTEEFINYNEMKLSANLIYFDKHRRKYRAEMYEREEYFETIPFLPSISNIRVNVR